jgi:hypothetical protein
MKRLNKILVPTDLSEKSLRALHYGSGLAAENQAAMVILHVANDLNAWELYSEDLAFIELNSKPSDRSRIGRSESGSGAILGATASAVKKSTHGNQAGRAGIGGEANRRCSGTGKHGFDRYGAAPASRSQTFFERRHYRPRHPVKPLPRAVDYGALAVKPVARQVDAATIRVATSK